MNKATPRPTTYQFAGVKINSKGKITTTNALIFGFSYVQHNKAHNRWRRQQLVEH